MRVLDSVDYFTDELSFNRDRVQEAGHGGSNPEGWIQA